MIARLIEPAISSALAQFPVVVLTGARQVGKTTLARWVRPDATYISLDDPARAAAARLTPDAFLSNLPLPVVLVMGLSLVVSLSRSPDKRTGSNQPVARKV